MPRRQQQWERVEERITQLRESADERRSVALAISGDVAGSIQVLNLIDAQMRAADFDEAQMHANLFVLQLRDLLRCAYLVDGLGFNLTAELDRFEAAMPDAKAARDVLTHFDEYRLGVGKLQPNVSAPLEICYERDGQGMALWFANPDFRFDLRGSLNAAQNLAEAILEVIHKDSRGQRSAKVP